jgi:hypothetical protein
MKTTVEVDDELMRRVKMRAIQRNQKLKDTIAQLLELGMAAERDTGPSPPPPKPVHLKKRGPLTIEDIESAIAAGRH